MIFTARQLEDLHRNTGANGQIVLPYRARLTPNAQDWVRQRKIDVGYSDVDASAVHKAATTSIGRADAGSPASATRFVWWCDGPCGPAKAAMVTQAKESALTESSIAQDANHLIPAIKHVAAEVKSGRATGAVLLVQSAAGATVYANRCPSLRAIPGTCLDAVDQGVSQVAANVLVVEHPYKTLSQVKNLVSRFIRGKRELSDDVSRNLSELTSCG
jgi:hypothetical protein